MVWISLTFGRAIGRLVLYGIAGYYVLFAPKARRFSRAYLSRALGRWAEWSDGFRHVLAFASTIHDRIYLLNDRFDLFDIEIIGTEALDASLAKQPGALLIGAHLGSFEVLRAVGRGRAGLKVAMLMYEENARKINAALEAINPAATADIIALGRMDSMIEARDKLDQGYLVGMLADRGLGDDATVDCEFLGKWHPSRSALSAWPPCCAGRCSSWPGCISAATATRFTSSRWLISRKRHAPNAMPRCAPPSSVTPNA
jgi:predicted LPLAT superfamily acyltransferase